MSVTHSFPGLFVLLLSIAATGLARAGKLPEYRGNKYFLPLIFGYLGALITVLSLVEFVDPSIAYLLIGCAVIGGIALIHTIAFSDPDHNTESAWGH